MAGFNCFSNTPGRIRAKKKCHRNFWGKLSFLCNFFFLQAVVERKVPIVELPIGDTLKTKKKVAVKPDKPVAIAKHQTRMRSTL